jgi:hypothetical protein
VFVSTTTFFVRSVDWQRRHVVRPVPHQHASVQGPHGRQWAGQRRNDLRADASVTGAAQRPAQRTVQSAGQPPVQPVAQNRPVREQQQQRWNGQQQQSWREQQQSRAQQRPEARTPHMNPSAAPAPSTAHDPVRPIGQPVRPISNTVPTIHNQPRAAHPFIESVRPRFEQRSQYRQAGGRAGQPQQQRRQAGQPQQRRG